MNIKEIKKEVQDLLEKTNFLGVYPTPVDVIATEHFGYICSGFKPTKETENISGAVFHKKKQVYYNLNDNIRRQLFTIAHELGHIVLHRDKGNIVDYRANENQLDPIENEANIFASEILMPEEEFRKVHKNFKGVLELISDHFGTSLLATSVRAKILGLSING